MPPGYERLPCGKFPRRRDDAGYGRGMFVRRHAVAALVVVALLTSGCGSPASPPTLAPTTAAPSPTDSAAAAYAAAEATYRAYVDALNAVDLDDPSTFEAALALTREEAKASAAASFENMRSQGWTVEGASRIASVSPNEVDEAQTHAILSVCLDVSQVNVVDEKGASVVGDRPDIQGLRVSVSRFGERWLITKFESDPGRTSC